MDFVLQRRFALDTIIPGDLRDQLSLLPVREDAIDVLTRNSSHGGKVGFAEVLSDYDAAALYRLTEMLREFDQRQRDPPSQGQKAFSRYNVVGVAQARRQHHQQDDDKVLDVYRRIRKIWSG